MNSEFTFDPWFLAPPQEAFNVEHSEYYIKHGEKKAIRRKIFERVPYDQFEQQCLVEFKEMIAQHKFVVPPNFRESSYLKMLQSGKYNMKKSFKALEQHVQWINNEHMHTLDKLSAQFLQEGNVYLCGRDKQYRPVLYMDCEHLDLKKQGADNITRAMCVFLETVKKNMFIDGKVENWIFVIDTKNKGIFDLPLKALGVIIDIMQVNFGGHLEKLYILNPSFGLSTTWSVIEKMIDEEAASKIKFLKKNKLDVLQNDIMPQYLQEKYSGTLPNVTQFWPPNDIYTTEEQRKEHQFKIDEAKNIKAAEQAAAELKAKNEKEAAAAAELKAKQDKDAAAAAEIKAKQDKEIAANNVNQIPAPVIQPLQQQTLIQEPVHPSKNEGLGMSNLGRIVQSSAFPEEQQHPKTSNIEQTESEQKPTEQQIINGLLNSANTQQVPFAGPLQESTNQMNINSTQIAAHLVQSQQENNISQNDPNKRDNNRQENPTKNDNDTNYFDDRNNIFIQTTSVFEKPPAKQGFNITINKVEDVQYIYNNENQYNHEDEQKKQDNKIPTSSNSPQAAAPKPNSVEVINEVKNTIEKTSAGVKEAANQFKEVKQGFVAIQEEVEEGGNMTVNEAGLIAKKAQQNVFSKNVSTQEDFQTIPSNEIDKPQQSGGCCSSSSSCMIF